MEGDFYKCEEVAFSEDVSSRLAKAALITQADSTRMEFFLCHPKAKWHH